MLNYKLTYIIKQISTTLAVILSFKCFICYALTQLGMDTFLPLVIGISAVITNMLKVFYFNPINSKEDLNTKNLLIQSLIIFFFAFIFTIIIHGTIDLIQIKYDLVKQLDFKLLKHVCEVMFASLTIVSSEQTNHGSGLKIINLSMDNSSSSNTSRTPSSSSASSHSSGSGSGSSSGSGSGSGSSSRPLPRSTLRAIPPLSGPGSPIPRYQPVPISGLATNANSGSSAGSGYGFGRERPIHPVPAPGTRASTPVPYSRDDYIPPVGTHRNPSWFKPFVEEAQLPMDELTRHNVVLENAIKKIEVGIKDGDFEKVVYNETDQRIYVRPNRGTSNDTRLFLNYEMNKDLANINYDRSLRPRIEQEAATILSRIPREAT